MIYVLNVIIRYVIDTQKVVICTGCLQLHKDATKYCFVCLDCVLQYITIIHQCIIPTLMLCACVHAFV